MARSFSTRRPRTFARAHSWYSSTSAFAAPGFAPSPRAKRDVCCATSITRSSAVRAAAPLAVLIAATRPGPRFPVYAVKSSSTNSPMTSQPCSRAIWRQSSSCSGIDALTSLVDLAA